MNKINYLMFSGVAMATAGACMLTSESIGVETARIIVPLLFTIAGVLAYLFSQSNKQHPIARQYHLLQGMGMVAFAILIGFFANSLEEFLLYITYFVGVFGLIEILFGFMALNGSHPLNMGILISRFVAGFFNLIGAVLILATSVTDEIGGLLVASVLVILGGVAFVLFSFRIRKG